MCVAGGMDANVYTCSSEGGTGMNGVIVRRFLNPLVVTVRAAGCSHLLPPRRVALAGPSAPLLCPCARWVRRGAVLCAGGPDVFVVVERFFCVVFSGPGV